VSPEGWGQETPTGCARQQTPRLGGGTHRKDLAVTGADIDPLGGLYDQDLLPRGDLVGR